ncbi:MAG: hypothetical protein ACTSU5_11880 [Promethearchaeota archaeon]
MGVAVYRTRPGEVRLVVACWLEVTPTVPSNRVVGDTRGLENHMS